MATRYRPYWLALLFLSCSTLVFLAAPAWAQGQQAVERARLLRTLSLIRGQVVHATPLTKAARAAGDTGGSAGVASEVDPNTGTPARGTGAIAGALSGLDPEAFATASVMAWTDEQYMDASEEGRGIPGMAMVMPDGTYRIEGLPAGGYYVTASAQDYVPAYYDNVTDLTQATRVAVVEGETTSGIDFTLERFVPGTGSIAGSVRAAADGRPIPGAAVYAYSPESPFLSGKTGTEEDGTYVISGLKTGRYVVEVWAEGLMQGFYDGATSYEEVDLVEVVEPATVTGIDFRLSTGGSISGYVRNEEGGPVAGAYVQATMPVIYAEPAIPEADGSSADSTGAVVTRRIAARDGWAVTDDSGFYRIGGLEPGDYYVMAQVSARWLYAYEWYEGTDTFERATPVTVGSEAETPGIDFQLSVPAANASVAGRVTDGEGHPIAEAFITVQEEKEDTAPDPETARTMYVWAYAATDSDGNYVVEELPAGRYLVSAATQSGWEYVQRWYVDAATPERATPVELGANERREGVDVVLPVQAGTANLGGVVRDRQGNLLPWAFVEVTPVGADPTDETRPVSLWAYAQTDSQGAYRVDRLPAGAYTVHASYGNGDTYGQGWYDGANTPEAGTPVVLADGETRGDIDFDIAVRPLYGSVQGTVADAATGAPLARAYVELSPVGWDFVLAAPFRFGGLYAVTDEAGRFEMTYVSEGAYVVTVHADGAYGQYADPDVGAEMTPVRVIGGEVNECDVSLWVRHDGDGVITGTVTADFSSGPGPLREGGPTWDAGGAPVGVVAVNGDAEEGGTLLEIAVVVASPVSNPDLRYTAVTRPDGTYALRGLAPSDYVVMSFAPGYIGEYYDGVYGPEEADPVHVDAENPAPRVDFALAPAYYYRLAADDKAESGPTSAAGPNGAAAVYGQVTDEAGNAVEDAAVYLLDETEKPVAYAQTGTDGTFELSGVAPGGYRVYASKLGFAASYNGNARDFTEAKAIPLVGGQLEVNLVLALGGPTAVEESGESESDALPHVLALQANYPNPFNPSTRIAFTVPASGRATVRVFDVLGQQVAVLFDRMAVTGRRYELDFEAGALSTGLYLYTLEFSGQRLGRTMMLVR